MRIVVFLHGLGLGGTEKAACRWAAGLVSRGHYVRVLSIHDGPRRDYLDRTGISSQVVGPWRDTIVKALVDAAPDVIHAHAPGLPFEGDVLGQALGRLPKIPVVQTNIFGRLENPPENSWVDFRLFISWTSCVQAARRASMGLDCKFFRRASVAVYPLDPDDGPSADEITHFRSSIGLGERDLVFGRFSRPDPNKWTNLAIRSFRKARKRHPHLKLLLREPPSFVSNQLKNDSDQSAFIMLSATSDLDELRRTMASCDVVLHTSIMGESFGYGIAEPMNFGKPVITHSVPWLDQAQLELVRHGECGFLASTSGTMASSILLLAKDAELRKRLGSRGKFHIRHIADPSRSLDRLEHALSCAVRSADSSMISEDITSAKVAAAYLDREQFGHSLGEQLSLRMSAMELQFRGWMSDLRKRLIRAARSATSA